MHEHFIGKLAAITAGINLHPCKWERDLVSSFYFNPSYKKTDKSAKLKKQKTLQMNSLTSGDFRKKKLFSPS